MSRLHRDHGTQTVWTILTSKEKVIEPTRQSNTAPTQSHAQVAQLKQRLNAQHREMVEMESHPTVPVICPDQISYVYTMDRYTRVDLHISSNIIQLYSP